MSVLKYDQNLMTVVCAFCLFSLTNLTFTLLKVTTKLNVKVFNELKYWIFFFWNADFHSYVMTTGFVLKSK